MLAGMRMAYFIAALVMFLCWASGASSARQSAEAERLVFSAGADSYAARIYTIRPDGSGLRRITHGRGRDLSPVWSPDRRRIAFVRGSKVGENFRGDSIFRERLTVMTSEGKRIYDLGPDSHSPAWSPDGTKLAFLRGYTESSTIWTVTSDGKNAQRLIRGENPAWSPDGRRIAFDRWIDPETAVFVMNADGTNSTRLLSKSRLTDTSGPAWSPDGRQIALVGEHVLYSGDGSGLYLVKPNGQDLTRLVRPVPMTSTGSAEWSPDSRWLTFDREDVLYRIGVDGRGLARLAKNDPRGSDWSPTGREIAFDRQSSPTGRRIYSVTINGSSLRPITKTMGYVGDFDW